MEYNIENLNGIVKLDFDGKSYTVNIESLKKASETTKGGTEEGRAKYEIFYDDENGDFYVRFVSWGNHEVFRDKHVHFVTETTAEMSAGEILWQLEIAIEMENFYS